MGNHNGSHSGEPESDTETLACFLDSETETIDLLSIMLTKS